MIISKMTKNPKMILSNSKQIRSRHRLKKRTLKRIHNYYCNKRMAINKLYWHKSEQKLFVKNSSLYSTRRLLDQSIAKAIVILLKKILKKYCHWWIIYLSYRSSKIFSSIKKPTNPNKQQEMICKNLYRPRDNKMVQTIKIWIQL